MKVICWHSISTRASNSRVKPESLPAHGGSTWRTAPSIPQSHPRNAHLEEALVLEEVQMPIALRHRIVDRMLAVHARNGERLPGAKSTRIVSVRACALKSAPATYHGAPMPNAVSNNFSVIRTTHQNYDKVPEFTHSDFNRGLFERCRR